MHYKECVVTKTHLVNQYNNVFMLLYNPFSVRQSSEGFCKEIIVLVY